MTEDTFTPQITGSSVETKSPDFSLLRAAPLHSILRHRGQVFETSEGTAESYDLSSQVDHIDTFVSHTWRTPRRKKFTTLSLHFGFPLAYACSLLGGCVVSMLGALRLLFFVEMESVTEARRVPTGPYGLLICPLVFWLVLFLHSDLLPATLQQEHRVFLDKVCIHQTNTRLKREGVAHLGIFLFFTGQLLVLHTDDYFERLWTVYEVATFLLSNPKGRLVMLPVNLSITIVVGSLAHTMSSLLSFTIRTAVVSRALPVYTPTTLFYPVVSVPFLLLLVLLTRRQAMEEKRRAEHLLYRFSIGGAKCANEADREPVKANIMASLRMMDHSREEATCVFEELVRQAVPEALQRSLGCSSVPYTYMLMLVLPFLGEGFDTVGSEIASGSTFREAFPRCWYWFAWHYGGGPVVLATISLLSRQCLHFRGFLLKGYVALVLIAALLVAFGVQALFSNLRALAAASDAFLIIDITTALVMTGIAYLFLQPRRGARTTARTTDHESAAMASNICFPIELSGENPARDSMSSSSTSVFEEQAVGSINVHTAVPSILGRPTLRNDEASTSSTPKNIRQVISVPL